MGVNPSNSMTTNSTLLSRSRTPTAEATDPRTPARGRRFMRRLSIGVKLWTTTAILAVPLIGLAVFYVQSLTSTLWFSGTEITGARLYEPLSALENDISIHSELSAAIALNPTATPNPSPTSPDALAPLESRMDAALAAFTKLNAIEGNPTTRSQAANLLQKWQSLRNHRPTDLEATLAAHAELTNAVTALRNQIATDWLLILDPELATYNLLDVALNKQPDAIRAASDAQVRMRSLLLDTGSRLQTARLLTLTALAQDRASSAPDELEVAQAAARNDKELARALESVDIHASTGLTKWCVEVEQALEGSPPTTLELKDLLTRGATVLNEARAARPSVLEAAINALQLRYERQRQRALFALGGAGVAMVAAILFMLALSGRVSGAIKRLLHITETIARGNYDTPIDATGSDEVSRLFSGIAQMQQRLKTQIAQERAAAAETARIKQALDFASANIMVTDEHLDIIYQNHASQRLFKESEADFRRDLPQFEASRVLGSSIDLFHRNSAHQHELLNRLKETYTANIKLGGHSLRLTTTPVADDQGQRIGTLMEWFDRTAEVNAEQEMSQVVKNALDGNLASRINATGKTGFYALLAQSLNQLLESVTEIVRQAKLASGEVFVGSEEIAQGNTNLSERTEKQASSLAQTAASMEQMTSSVRHNAENANKANELAQEAHSAAVAGGDVTSNAIGAMNAISESSQKINAIIAVIDEIAFQTNLLALNAAVEAARAGEQGRGFAVVATEVRNLAGRSAVAAHEIKSLIEESVSKVDSGSRLVTQCAEALKSIISSAQSVSTIVSEIATASQEQAKGIDQVSTAIGQMEEITQQNASLVEQIAAASQNMTQQARDLNQQMTRFTLSATDASSDFRQAIGATSADTPGRPNSRKVA